MTGHRGRRRALVAAALTAMTIVGTAIAGSTPAFATAPSNDDIANATAIGSLPYTTTEDTTEATVAVDDDPYCGAATVWFTFTPSTDGTYAFDTFGSDYDTTLAVYAGSPGSLNELTCSDDTQGLQAGTALDLSAGTTYYIAAGTCCDSVVGQVGPGGTLVFNAYVATPLEMTLSLDSKATISSSDPTTATVTGTVTCNQDANVDIDGTLTQRQGLNVLRSEFYAFLTCSTTPTTWTADASSFSRLWLPKQATVTFGGDGCALTCVEIDQTTHVIKLVRG